MSVEQGVNFAEELRKLSDQFREDSRVRTEEYIDTLEGITDEFQTESHDYAKDMVEAANKYTLDIQALYQSIYPPETEGGNGE
jgi:hypothetical protein